MSPELTSTPLSADAIRDGAGAAAEGLLGLEVVAETGSTNADLLALPPGEAHRRVRMADRQLTGRGRRGRRWQSPEGRNVYLSLGWRFDVPPDQLGFLPLATAVAAARALAALGLSGHGVKWPNDLVRGGHKLGGCLVELRGRGPSDTVIGVGLNVHLRGAEEATDIDQPWTDLGAHLPGVTRNAVAGALIGELVAAMEAYEAGISTSGPAGAFAPFVRDWDRWDVLQGQPVRVMGTEAAGPAAPAIARGLGPRGGLLLERDGIMEELLAGEVSVRLSDP